MPPDAGDIGFGGCRHKTFLQEYRPVTFNQLVLSGELFKYLALFNQEATERLESLIQSMKVAQGITEELKGRDQMAWVGAINPSAIPRCKAGCWLHAAIASNSNARQALPDLQIRACSEEVAASAFDTIGTALYDLRERIAAMQQSHLQETIRQSIDKSDSSTA